MLQKHFSKAFTGIFWQFAGKIIYSHNKNGLILPKIHLPFPVGIITIKWFCNGRRSYGTGNRAIDITGNISNIFYPEIISPGIFSSEKYRGSLAVEMTGYKKIGGLCEPKKIRLILFRMLVKLFIGDLSSLNAFVVIEHINLAVNRTFKVFIKKIINVYFVNFKVVQDLARAMRHLSVSGKNDL